MRSDSVHVAFDSRFAPVVEGMTRDRVHFGEYTSERLSHVPKTDRPVCGCSCR